MRDDARRFDASMAAGAADDATMGISSAYMRYRRYAPYCVSRRHADGFAALPILSLPPSPARRRHFDRRETARWLPRRRAAVGSRCRPVSLSDAAESRFCYVITDGSHLGSITEEVGRPIDACA